MNVADIVSRWAADAPYRVAIAGPNRVVPFRALEEAVWRAAAALAADGLRPGDRVGLAPSGNAALWLVAVYALARLGAVFLLLDPTDPPALREAVARRFALTAVLGDGPAARIGNLPLLQPSPRWLEPGPAAADPRLRSAGGDAPLMICLSSGTTGAPKAMMRTHHDHAAIGAAARGIAVAGAEDRLLVVTPLHFSYGFVHAMRTLDGGGTLRLAPLPLPVDELCRIVDRENITRLALTPTQAEEIMRRLPEDGPRFPGLQELMLSTAAAPAELRRALRRGSPPTCGSATARTRRCARPGPARRCSTASPRRSAFPMPASQSRSSTKPAPCCRRARPG